MRLDPHVHTSFSGRTSLYPLKHLLRESYNSPEGVYRLAKERGMDLVAITDHDTIDGALTLADREDVIVGCEVTAAFPDDGVRVHLCVLDINEVQYHQIERLRANVRELLPYLKREEIFTTLNHVASAINGRITADHIATLVPWIDAIEVRNGSRLPAQNRTAAALAAATRKVPIGASDSHARHSIGRTFVDVPHARTREEFMAGLRAGRVVVHGRDGSYMRLAADIVQIAASFYGERFQMLARSPGKWRNHAVAVGAVVGLPLLALPFLAAFAHFVLEDRFNQSLLFDLVARPATRSIDAA